MAERPIRFEITQRSKGSAARAGVLHTPHGDIETPAFVAVATKATVKGVPMGMLKDLGVQVVIVNGYHLYLSGLEAVEKAGGLSKFMGWNGPTMTDSGGFQVFSLGTGFGKKISKFAAGEISQGVTSTQHHNSRGDTFRNLPNPVLYDEDLATSHGKLAIVDEDGVTFTSHVDGSLHRFTPERSIEIQHKLGADVIFAFDECTAPTASYEEQKDAADRTERWARRSLAAHRQNFAANQNQFIYGIGQGGQFDDLRRESARAIGAMGFDGFGLGGSFSKKYGNDSLQSALEMLLELPSDMPIHGLGVGEPLDLINAAAAGVDTFDCVTPTRNGRTGTVYTSTGKMNIENARYREDFEPIDRSCTCFVCLNHTRAYINHLFRNKETLALILASAHNVHFLAYLGSKIRTSILDGNFEQFREQFIALYQGK